MRIRELLESSSKNPDLIEILRAFLPFAVNELELSSVPKIKLHLHLGHDEQPSFGSFNNETKIIDVAIEDRHPLDILRTLAHEMVHYKQEEETGLRPGAGKTGSPEEGEAHELAGIVMRNFNKAHPEFFKSDAINLEEGWSNKYKRSINCSSPKGFSQRAHCQGKKKNEDFKESSSSNKKEAVLRIQRMLNKKFGANLDIDGVLGPLTIKSINKFMPNAKVGLADDPNRTTAVQGKTIKNTDVEENFADGRNPQDKGDSKRHGINTKASVSSLRKTAKQGGRKGQLAHWLANMKAGRAKKK